MVTKTKNSRLYKLNPFLDKEGMLRVGGCLSQAMLHPYVKHPVIFPKNRHMSALLIRPGKANFIYRAQVLHNCS